MAIISHGERRLVKIIGTDQHGLPTEEILRAPRLHRFRIFLLKLLPLPLARMLGLTRLRSLSKIPT
jgi:hypothetical protein